MCWYRPIFAATRDALHLTATEEGAPGKLGPTRVLHTNLSEQHNQPLSVDWSNIPLPHPAADQQLCMHLPRHFYPSATAPAMMGRTTGVAARPALQLGYLALICSFLLLFLVHLSVSESESVCWNHDGPRTNNTGLHPCRSADGDESKMCCKAGDICLNSKLCVSGGIRSNNLYTSGCTEEDWATPDCYWPLPNNRQEGIFQSGVNHLHPCPDNKEWWYCQLQDDMTRELKKCLGPNGLAAADCVLWMPQRKNNRLACV